jgi:hypothetical protein
VRTIHENLYLNFIDETPEVIIFFNKVNKGELLVWFTVTQQPTSDVRVHGVTINTKGTFNFMSHNVWRVVEM